MTYYSPLDYFTYDVEAERDETKIRCTFDHSFFVD